MIIDKGKKWQSQTEDKRTFKMKWAITPERGEYTKEEIEAAAEQYEGIDAGDILITCTMVEIEDEFLTKWQGYDARRPDVDGKPGKTSIATVFRAWMSLTRDLSISEEMPPILQTFLQATLDTCEEIFNLSKEYVANRISENPFKS